MLTSYTSQACETNSPSWNGHTIREICIGSNQICVYIVAPFFMLPYLLPKSCINVASIGTVKLIVTDAKYKQDCDK